MATADSDPVLLTPSEHEIARQISRIANCNPFVRERIALERELLGDAFDDRCADWNTQPGGEDDSPNVQNVIARSEALLATVRSRLASAPLREGEIRRLRHTPAWQAFEDTLLFAVYHRLRPALNQLVGEPRAAAPRATAIYHEQQALFATHTSGTGLERQWEAAMPHFFAGFAQLRRAFGNIYGLIVGVSKPASRLRAAVWQSIFTHDMHHYRLALYERMADFSTLVTGPSGTGKELVARAVGLSRYVPFEPREGRFADSSEASFYPIHLAAMSPTLIEAELFGHARGAFTGAVGQRTGWFEACPATGVIFLDEVGELAPSIQVKLLRVLQQREFSRIGETKIRRFAGKIVAATNRSLDGMMRSGDFREDLFYRLCSDMVEVPSLRERLDDDPRELSVLTKTLVGRMLGGDASRAAAIEERILESVGDRYAWPGNIRELEQCIRNVLVRGHYQPTAEATTPLHAADGYGQLVERMRKAAITADELVTRYCQLDYAQTGNFQATGRRLRLDRRTVKAKLDEPRG
jgi:transcriptional regulator with AAA-type ATPase domain